MEQVNLIPFYACAIEFARHIRLDLESEYGKNAVAYYNAAKQSEYYNTLFSEELSLQTEEAYKKHSESSNIATQKMNKHRLLWIFSSKRDTESYTTFLKDFQKMNRFILIV